MNLRRALAASSVAIPVVLLFAWGMTRDPRDIPSPLPGRAAPDFALEVFAPGEAPFAAAVGDTIRLAAHAGEVRVVNFWASWCLACRDEHSALSATARRYADQPVRFVGILYQDRPAPAIEWIAEMGGQSYPSVDDPRSRAAIDYGLFGVPETFIIGPDGRIVHKQTGPITAEILEIVIDRLLAQRPAADSGAAERP
ncbi:MAG: redoxin domain-containing protein [Gemmatimonadaceae bacterium]